MVFQVSENWQHVMQRMSTRRRFTDVLKFHFLKATISESPRGTASYSFRLAESALYREPYNLHIICHIFWVEGTMKYKYITVNLLAGKLIISRHSFIKLNTNFPCAQDVERPMKNDIQNCMQRIWTFSSTARRRICANTHLYLREWVPITFTSFSVCTAFDPLSFFWIFVNSSHFQFYNFFIVSMRKNCEVSCDALILMVLWVV